ncbi:hypothetical protein AAC387_Pa02g0370 [Persea americana]
MGTEPRQYRGPIIAGPKQQNAEKRKPKGFRAFLLRWGYLSARGTRLRSASSMVWVWTRSDGEGGESRSRERKRAAAHEIERERKRFAERLPFGRKFLAEYPNRGRALSFFLSFFL